MDLVGLAPLDAEKYAAASAVSIRVLREASGERFQSYCSIVLIHSEASGRGVSPPVRQVSDCTEGFVQGV